MCSSAPTRFRWRFIVHVEHAADRAAHLGGSTPSSEQVDLCQSGRGLWQTKPVQNRVQTLRSDEHRLSRRDARLAAVLPGSWISRFAEVGAGATNTNRSRRCCRVSVKGWSSLY